jgi:hypothetical protein
MLKVVGLLGDDCEKFLYKGWFDDGEKRGVGKVQKRQTAKASDYDEKAFPNETNHNHSSFSFLSLFFSFCLSHLPTTKHPTSRWRTTWKNLHFFYIPHQPLLPSIEFIVCPRAE